MGLRAIRNGGALVAFAGLVASCGDLFHSTTWRSLCDADPTSPGCSSPGTTGAATNGAAANGAGGAGGEAGLGGGGEAAAGGQGGGGGGCAAAEDCATALDDDCDGLQNAGCPPVGYLFGEATLEPYFDEAHNIATSGDPADPTGRGQLALGQLTDGIEGVDDFGADLGNGAAFEWVLWVEPKVTVVFDFGVPRDVFAVTIGTSNVGGYVFQPSAVEVAFGDDPAAFGAASAFTLADGTLPAIAIGKRADITLAVQGTARYARITLVQASNGGAEAIDEVTFP